MAEFDPPNRSTPPDAREQVLAMPRRMAHALHALLTASSDGTPPIAAEILAYDEEALSGMATAAALREAARRGYCGCANGVWFATVKAMDLRGSLEERYLVETEELGDGEVWKPC